MWAVSIHLVTAFLLAGLPARPFWNTRAARAPVPGLRVHRGPGVRDPAARTSSGGRPQYPIADGAFSKLALITTVAAQINLVMLISELFYEFYSPTHHGISARYLFFGLGEHHALVPVDLDGDRAQRRGDGHRS